MAIAVEAKKLVAIQSEKAVALGENSRQQLVLRVAHDVNKHQIAADVSKQFAVRVDAVRTAVMPGKHKRRGSTEYKTSRWKKAYVLLAPGERVNLYAAE